MSNTSKFGSHWTFEVRDLTGTMRTMMDLALVKFILQGPGLHG
jgi:hypothetical protein